MSTTQGAELVAQFERAVNGCTRYHTEYIGKEMPDREYERFARLRDETIPRLRAELIAALRSHGPQAGEPSALQAEIDRLNAIINTPHADDFWKASSIESEHQRQRWGAEGDAGKTPADWFWLVGYLAGKTLHAHAAGNAEKAEHHIITTASACANWHRAVFGKTDMRPGTDRAALAQAKKDGEA